jgi:hypothetical protein
MDGDTRAAGAVQAAGGQAGEQELAALQWNWGDAYLIGHDDEHGWWASRRDQIGALITEAGPDELAAAISVDYTCKPVPRDLPPVLPPAGQP